jgi:hypothetical protein
LKQRAKPHESVACNVSLTLNPLNPLNPMKENYPSNQTEKLECALRLLLSAFDRKLSDGRAVNQTLSLEAKEAFYGPILGARLALQSIKSNE